MTGASRRLRIVLHSNARDTVAREASRALPFETGGVLLGYREDGDIVVTDALAVRPDSAERRQYIRDDVRANALLHNYLSSRDGDDLTGYVGEWHSHPQPVAPSGIDLRAIRATAKGAQGPIALLVCTPGSPSRFRGMVAKRARFRRVSTEEADVEVVGAAEAPLGPLPAGAVRADGPVFISYRQSDGSARASAIEGLLRAAGLVVWRDRNDLRAGTTTDRLEQALTGGLSGAVLVVTPEIAESSIVQFRELPRLLQLDEDPAFSLCIANDIPDLKDPSKPDFKAPDVLLGRAPNSTLGDKKQTNSQTDAGRLEIVRDLVMHRIEQRKERISEQGGVITILTQTRPEPYASDAGQSDLHVRLRPAERSRLPSGQGLKDLKATLSVTSDAVYASGARTARISGGMHLSVALAIGAALPETKIGHVEVVDLGGEVWTSRTDDDPGIHNVVTQKVQGQFAPAEGGVAKIAVFVTLTANADDSAFRQLLDSEPGAFSSAAMIAIEPADLVDPREAARISVQVAMEIKRLSAQFGRAEVHLAYHGPYTIAVLVARFLNTVRTVVYEWDNDEETGPAYYPVATLAPGVAGGPITKVHL